MELEESTSPVTAEWLEIFKSYRYKTIKELLEICEEYGIDSTGAESRSDLQILLRQRDLLKLNFPNLVAFAKILKLEVTEKDSIEKVISVILNPKGRDLPKQDRWNFVEKSKLNHFIDRILSLDYQGKIFFNLNILHLRKYSITIRQQDISSKSPPEWLPDESSKFCMWIFQGIFWIIFTGCVAITSMW